jgi:signal transduction histidine kinase
MNSTSAISLLTLLEIETGLLIILAAFSIYKSMRLSQLLKEMLHLRRNYEEQLKTQKERDDFLAMLVHELRSPLSVMKGASDLILKDAQRLSKEQIETLLTQIRTSSKGMLKIVDDILDVSKIDSGKFEIHKIFGDLNKVVSDECEYYEALAGEKQIKITTQLDTSLPSFNFDEDRVRQVMNNLLSNAIKYITEKGHITVLTKKDQSKVQVIIADDGDGIADDLKVKLFHKFVQLNNHSHTKDAGSGLGLVITKGIVQAHGGEIWIEDNAPRGAKFIFTLPLS